MDLMHERCAGLDVHKDSVSAHVRIQQGRTITRHEDEFGTTTKELLRLLDWLQSHGVTAVAMEATGVYWKPVWHVLEGSFKLILANARDVKNVPGRKTDAKDAEWITDLLAHGLIRPSFVPPQAIQQLRDLTRTRTQLTRQRSQHVQRIQKVLEDANVKLASVLTDILGVSGRRILEAIIGGEADPAKLAALTDRRVKASREAIAEALHGRVSNHHRFILGLHLAQIDSADAALALLEGELEQRLIPLHEVRLGLQTIPGVREIVSAVILAEIGTDMSNFPTHDDLLRWACLKPGQNESAGKRRRTRTKPKRWLKPQLVQAAWAAVREKERTYLHAQFHRIRRRQGSKKAIVAVAASMLTAAYYIIRDGVEYVDLGSDYFDKRDRTQHARNLVKRLRQLGYEVDIRSVA